MAPHHRRRRSLGLALLALLVVLIAIVASSGGGGTRPRHVAVVPALLVRLAAFENDAITPSPAAELAAESAAVNRVLAYTPYVRIAGAQHREIALTFDDGPGPYTPQVISILAHAGVPGTFFEVGVLEKYFSQSTSDIVSHGWVIGDHTQAHAPMSHLSAADQRAQVLEQTSVIGDYGAPFPRLFRPPFGLWNPTTLSILHGLRMLMVLWTVDTSDYRLPGVDAIVHSAVSGARPGAIILLHDAGGNRAETVQALPIIIRDLKAQGYKLVTVPRLLLDNPPPANQEISAIVGTGG